MAYFDRFWEPSGKVAVQTLAAAATGVIFSFGLPFVFCFLLSRGKTLLFVQELNLDHPSRVGGMPKAGRSPSGREADRSPRAQV